MKNRLILFKTSTDVELYGENDEINRNIESSTTIALWEFFWSNVFNPLILRIMGGGVHVTMATVKRKLEIIIPIRNKSRTVFSHNTENGKLKGHIP